MIGAIGSNRCHRTDRELFMKSEYHWDVKRYKEELDKQVELKKLSEQVRKTRDRVLDCVLLEEDKKKANFNKTVRNGNIENLLKSFYGGAGVRNNSAHMDSFIQAAEQPSQHPVPMQELPNKRDHIKFNLTGYAERDDDIIKKQKQAYHDQLNQQMLNNRMDQNKEALNQLQEDIRESHRIDQQRVEDAQAELMAQNPSINFNSSRRYANAPRPRTPVEESMNPFEKIKMEEELLKYKHYLQHDLPEMVTKQINDIFDREHVGLKALMKERDQLLRMQLGSFNDYLKIMDHSRTRELSDLNSLKWEVEGLKQANDDRVRGVENALTQTDQMLADEIEWKKANDPLNSLYKSQDTLKMESSSPWDEGRYLHGLTSKVDIKKGEYPLDENQERMKAMQSSFLTTNNAREYVGNEITKPDTLAQSMFEMGDRRARDHEVDDIINKLDHVMDEINDDLQKSHYSQQRNSYSRY